MYEDALELVNSRSKDIQNDQYILNQLSTSSLSIPESWDQIVHIRNGAIRYAACCSFLNEEIGKGEVRQTGDVKVIYSTEDMTIMLPGKSDSKRQICVTFDKLPCLTSNPNSSEDSPSKQELDINAYVSLLRRNGSIPDRVRLRGPADARFWPSFACYLYYFIFLHPSDIIQGRCELSYWEAQQEMKKQERQNRMKKKWLDWTAQRNLVSYFSERIYQKLLLFEMPVFIQVDQSLMPADKFFAYVK